MGGNAFSHVGDIHFTEINDTVTEFMEKLNITNYKLIGSTGKKEFSGDVDIAVDISVEELIRKLSDIVGIDNVRNFGNCYSVFADIVGYDPNKKSRKRTGVAQLDFIIGDIDWLEVYYFWDPTSKLKGTHRNIAISTLCHFVGVKIYDSTLDEHGRHKNYNRYKWSPNHGLIYNNYTTKYRPNGACVKKQVETTVSPGLKTPSEIAAVLFQGRLSDKYLYSAESIVEAICLMFDGDTRTDILKELFVRFENNHNVDSWYENYPDALKEVALTHGLVGEGNYSVC